MARPGTPGRGEDGASPPPRSWSLLPRPLFCGGNRVHLLEGGDELFPAMQAAIAGARREVWLSTYIFHDDDTALALADALLAAAHRGVRVRVVVDGFGSKATLRLLRERLTREHGGVALAVFRPMDRWWSWLQPGQMRRLHHKLCTVDGELAFVGGINIIDDRLDLRHGRSQLPRLDFAVEVSGPLALPVEQAVRAVWTRAWLGRDLREEVMAIARSAEPVLQARRLFGQLRMPRGANRQAELGELPPVRAAFVLRDNLRQRRTIERSYVTALRNATRRVDLISSYFYPGAAFRRALRDAARRGVQVRVLLQGKLDYRIAGLAARALYDELLASGVAVYEYRPAFLHAKVAVVDDDWCTVGSSNIDPLSLLMNLEANVIVSDTAFAAALRARFEQALAVSHRVEASEQRDGGLAAVLRRGLVAWCAYVYLRLGGASGRY